MLNSLFDVLYVLTNRTDLSLMERLLLVYRFWWFSFVYKIVTPNNTVTFMGYPLSFRTYPNLHTIVKEIFFFGEYVPRTRKQEPFIIDCGGNLGIATLHLKHLFPKARILVLEPSLENFKILEKNLEQNHVSNVQAVRAAACDKDGEITFWDNPQKPGGATSTQVVVATKTSSQFTQETVPAVKLSRFIDQPVDLLKMDIEGGEGIVLRELDESGALQRISEIVFEYHMNPLNTSNRLMDILQILERNGFNVIPFGIDIAKGCDRITSRPSYHFMLRAFKHDAS